MPFCINDGIIRIFICDSCQSRSRAGPATGNVDPLSQAGTFLALNVHDVRVAAAAAAHAVLLRCVKLLPVFVLLGALAFVERCLLEPGLARQLAGGGIGGTMLDRGMAVAEVAEVMDVARGEEGAGGKGVNRCVTPLCFLVSD